MKYLHNYKKLFFHKPLLTKDNLRLFYITGTVAFFVFTTIYISVNWAINVPTYVLSQKVTLKYISFLVEEKEKFQAEVDINSLLQSNGILEKSKQKESNQIYSDITLFDTPKKLILMDQLPKQLHETQKYSLDTTKIIGGKPGELVNEAINNIPGFIRQEILTEKEEQQLNLQNGELYFEQFDKQVRIPEPKVFKFASSNGNRNPDETIAILEINEIDVEHCFKRFSRYYPNFSGDIKISFTIHPDGHVIPSSIKVLQSNISEPRIINCIKKSIQRWKNFPVIAFEEGNFTVTRKYIF
jgi:hypothetical protein